MTASHTLNFCFCEPFVGWEDRRPACALNPVRAVFALGLLCTSSVIFAQQPERRTVDTDQPEKAALVSGVIRISGLEPTSHIHYVRLVLSGSLHTPSLADSPAPSPWLTLIAQRTLKPSSKSPFALFAYFWSATCLPFYSPWTPASKQDLFPPRTY